MKCELNEQELVMWKFIFRCSVTSSEQRRSSWHRRWKAVHKIDIKSHLLSFNYSCSGADNRSLCINVKRRWKVYPSISPTPSGLEAINYAIQTIWLRRVIDFYFFSTLAGRKIKRRITSERIDTLKPKEDRDRVREREKAQSVANVVKNVWKFQLECRRYCKNERLCNWWQA